MDTNILNFPIELDKYYKNFKNYWLYRGKGDFSFINEGIYILKKVIVGEPPQEIDMQLEWIKDTIDNNKFTLEKLKNIKQSFIKRKDKSVIFHSMLVLNDKYINSDTTYYKFDSITELKNIKIINGLYLPKKIFKNKLPNNLYIKLTWVETEEPDYGMFEE